MYSSCRKVQQEGITGTYGASKLYFAFYIMYRLRSKGAVGVVNWYRFSDSGVQNRGFH